MTTQEITTTTAQVLVAVPMLDAVEARQIVNNITRRIDQCRRDLLELKDREGWKALGYPTWRACVEAEFGSSTATLYRQLEAAEIARELGDSQFENMPTSHLQAVKALPPAQARQALSQASAATQGRPTVKDVQQAVQAVTQPDLPLEFAIVQRRFDLHGHVLSSAWDGHTLRFVLRKDGGTGVVMLWPAVLDRLSLLEDGMDDDEPAPPPASESASTYAVREARDVALIGEARALLAQGKAAEARERLSAVQVATWERDKVLREITTTTARAFLLEQRDRLTRFSVTAMVSQTTFKEALGHLAALLEATE